MAYTTIDNPELHFQCKIYTGNGGTLSLTLDGDEDMQPDLVWVKSRTQNNSHVWFDVIRGFAGGKEIQSNNTGAENASDSGGYGYVSAVGSDGFTVQAGSTAGDYTNVSSQNYVAWCFKGGGSASSNSNGSITSSVSANTTAGFSISTLDVGDTGNITFGHGIGAAPTFFVIKATSGTGGWVVYSLAVGNNKYLYLNNNEAAATSTSVWQNTAPTSTVISTNSSDMQDDREVVCYAFAPIKGYSKFGTYSGTGSGSGGAFVFTGFKPALIIMKETDGVDHFGIYDNKRNPGPGNVNGNPLLQPSDNGAESNAVANQIDFLSNGFKICAEGTNGNFINESGKTYFYAAFAESPFVNSKGVPCNAR